MTKARIDLTGQRFGRLTVIKYVGESQWLCKCDCGNETIVDRGHLRTGHTKSCGCLKLRNENHGTKHHLTHTTLHRLWCGMIGRCYVKSNSGYKNYGGRGITVCEEWNNDFMSFYNWAIANGWKEGLTIDRIDVNGNYEPSNCRWVEWKTQARNKRNNTTITWNGETHCLKEWEEITNLPICKRYFNGWTIEDMFTKPKRNSLH